MAEIEIGYVGEIESSWGLHGWDRHGGGREGALEAHRALQQLEAPSVDVSPQQVACDRCHLYYWAPRGACPECES